MGSRYERQEKKEKKDFTFFIFSQKGLLVLDPFKVTLNGAKTTPMKMSCYAKSVSGTLLQ